MKAMNNLRGVKRRLIALAATATLGASLVMVPAAGAANITIGGPSDCDANAIINCGAHSSSALMAKYHASASVMSAYNYFGITMSDASNMPTTLVAGKVSKKGNVFINGHLKAVAINALTAGRQNMPGSSRVALAGGTIYTRPPAVSFQQTELPAFVAMSNGRFQYAVIASCGNPVKATPVVAPAPAPKPVPKPTPAPTRPAPRPQVQTQTQSQAQVQANNQVNQQTNSQPVRVTNNNVNNNTNTVTTTASTPAATTTTTVASQAAAQPAAASSEVSSSQQPVEQPAASETTSVLPNTGPSGLIVAFLIASTGGFLAYRRYLSRRLNQTD